PHARARADRRRDPPARPRFLRAAEDDRGRRRPQRGEGARSARHRAHPLHAVGRRTAAGMTVTTPTRSAMLVAAASRALAVAGIFDMNGHVSVREGSVAYVNSYGASRLSLRAEEVAVVRIADGKELEHTPPSEMPLHLGAYRARPDVGAVVHAHPLFATTFAVAGRPLVCAFN